ncbi:tachykinin-like peptides receptor 99D [Brachionus plicatilis]|uniref:Tachykinin-like peptides receptor 99D n=1 Tax=Brachionus plicatilis TaxID=10195 RepID=A0A3M7T3F9_BRAPC|nr:tachykinin-like peptides receptor 99D [Brachionus plicatilis]
MSSIPKSTRHIFNFFGLNPYLVLEQLLECLKVKLQKQFKMILFLNLMYSKKSEFQAAILQKWIWTDVLCKLGPFSTTLNINVSVLTLVVITLDRFYVIFFPLKPKLRVKHSIIIIFFIWFISIIMSSYNLLNYEIKYDDCGQNESPPEKHCGLVNEVYLKYHLILLTIVQFGIPILIISSTSLAIFYRFYFNSTNYPESYSVQQKQFRNKKKMTKMILIVLFVFVICWTPLQLYNILQIIYSKINNFYYINIIWLIVNMIAMSNSCYNFIIYGMYSTKYRHEFSRIFRSLLCISTKFDRKNSNARSFTIINKDSARCSKRSIGHRPSNQFLSFI